MYNAYMPNNYNPQANLDKINAQINELEKMKAHMQQPVQQPTNLTQNFQIAPNNNSCMRYAESLEEVKRDMVIGDTPFFSKDLSVLWVKNVKGDIKTFELNEIIEKDEKDLQIEFLQAQIDDLKKGMVINEQYNANVIPTENEESSTRNDETTRATTKASKSTSLSRVSRSKEK